MKFLKISLSDQQLSHSDQPMEKTSETKDQKKKEVNSLFQNLIFHQIIQNMITVGLIFSVNPRYSLDFRDIKNLWYSEIYAILDSHISLV